MNRSFSKIRHIQEANQRLEKRFLVEAPKDEMGLDDELDDITSDFNDEVVVSFDDEDEMNSDDDYQDMGLDYDDEMGGDEYEDLDKRKYREISMKKFKPQDLYGQARRWSQGDDKYEPYNPIKKSDMNLDDYLKSKGL